ncbi:MAG: gliding motility-associated ABC transporter substrate-binding protein GldG [Cytophagales bacterium]|nr:gliding motility-associated ABC transporter substrate-binding protein GldG [Bernardetiaceae bacterium]MDW8211161.1 gliding motility-associated ABC transporter substrate-binding protein GldG [Cytophagales bacterium]
MNRQVRKWEDLLQWTAVALGLLCLNLFISKFFIRVDLTQDKRYSIAPGTRSLLENLKSNIYVEIYLEGELNAGFRRLQAAIKQTLEEFNAYSNGRVQFRFVNPETAKNAEQRAAFQRQLVNAGIQPTNLFETTSDGKRIQKIIFPGAIVRAGTRQGAVNFLKGNLAATAQERLNQSVEGVEFELASAIKKVTQQHKPRIALIQGHGELKSPLIGDLKTSLEEFFVVEEVMLSNDSALANYQVAVIIQPTRRYTEEEKFRLDQFIMGGGKALFMVDMVQMNLDSIAINGAYAFGYDLNLEDMLFRYGVRVNMNLVQDLQMGTIVVNVGQFGNAPNLQPVPWPYYVLANQFGKHPITRNLNAIYTKFVSSIDTVKSKGQVRKIPLVMTNQYSRIRRAPTIVSLEELKADTDPEKFTQSHIPIAYLLEGKFHSLFRNRFAPEGISQQAHIIQESVPTQIAVIGDGDVAVNELDRRTKQPLPLGFDPITKQTFSNKELILNTLLYFTDKNGLLEARLKEVKLRPLDKVRVGEEKIFWQSLNLLLPLLITFLLGGAWYYIRQKRYAKQTLD